MANTSDLFMCLCFLCVFAGFSRGKLVVSFPTIPCARGQICVAIKKCPYFDELLNRTTKPLPPNVVKIIREAQCGFQGDTPYVCCSIPTQRPEVATSPETNLQNQIRSLKSHPNYKKLPNAICGHISTGSRITNGKKTDVNEFPWMVLIAYKSEGSVDFRCGGTIINEWHVLTAAHCVINSIIVGVRLGEHNLETETDCNPQGNYCAPPTQDLFVEKSMVHPEYDPHTFANDIALIKLSSPTNFSHPNIQPICLPFEAIDLTGKFAVITGWGVTESGNKSPDLMKVFVPVMPISDCQSIYQNFAPITSKQICAGGYKGRDSCGGDSGGPLKYVGIIEGSARYMQFGIVSYGPRHCGTDGKPGIYTAVSHYLDWILDNVDHTKPRL